MNNKASSCINWMGYNSHIALKIDCEMDVLLYQYSQYESTWSIMSVRTLCIKKMKNIC